jgi:hypothetical protein
LRWWHGLEWHPIDDAGIVHGTCTCCCGWCKFFPTTVSVGSANFSCGTKHCSHSSCHSVMSCNQLGFKHT